MKNNLSLLVICLCTQLSFGQIFKDLQLANSYSKNGECEKAITIYKKLNKSSDQLQSFYKNYFDCLLKEEKFYDAILLAKKMQKKSSTSPIYLCDIGIVYKAKGNDALATRTFNRCLEKLQKAKLNDIYTLARKWSNIGENELAIEAYLKGQEIFPKQEFGFQLANAYRSMGKTEKMIDTYIDLIIKKSSNKRNIQITLQNTLGRTKTSDSYKILKDKKRDLEKFEELIQQYKEHINNFATWPISVEFGGGNMLDILQISETKELRVSELDDHPNELGHKSIANKLIEYINDHSNLSNI